MSDECSVFVRRVQETKVSPMPIIGFYVAAASYACLCAMSLDFRAMIRKTRLRAHMDFSCNYFALTTTWLMVLGVAIKLTGDLTSLMWSPQDNLVKISSTAFLTMAMGNFFTTLGSMTDKDILTNVTTLGILVISALVNLCIQLYTGAIDYSLFPGIIFSIVLLFCMFIIFVCSALAVPAIKKCAELKYQKLASQLEGQPCDTVEELRLSVAKYWVMAASGSPQFLVKRLATFLPTGTICLLSFAILPLEYRRLDGRWKSFHCQQESDYKESIEFIIQCQNVAWLPSTEITAILMLCVMYYKYEDNGIKISREEFIIESYWTKTLVEWRQSSLSKCITRRKVRKTIYNVKGLILAFCIRLQIVIVLCSKFCYVLTFYSLLPVFFFNKYSNKLLLYPLLNLLYKNEVPNGQGRPEIDHNCFVILLEGEKQFPKALLRTILFRADEHVKIGKKYKPDKLFNLLSQSFSFSGVVEFDSNRVPCLLSSEPPNCWTLPVVTLTTIAIALPNIASQHVDWLVNCVDEGLRYATLIDVLDDKCGLKNIKNAADVVWDGVELHKKWLEMDLERKTGEVNSAKEIIQVLADVAERIVMKFSFTENIIVVENPLHWPANVLAANSMYRISRTILLCYENVEYQAQEIFQKLMCMIADIMTACLTNLPHLIATKCKCNAIEEREKSVSLAAILLAETEDILKHFEKRKLSSLVPNKPLYIDEWRRWMETQDPIVSTSATINGTTFTTESNEEVVVQMQS